MALANRFFLSFFPPEGHLRLFDGDRGVRLHRGRDEGVRADHHVVPDLRRAAEERRAGVDRHVVAHLRVAALAGHAPHARGRERAQRHTLIDLDVIADDARLANDDAGAVVDEEIFADGGAGVDVDARARVGILGHDARDHRHVADVQLMGDAINENGEKVQFLDKNNYLNIRFKIIAVSITPVTIRTDNVIENILIIPF